MSSRDNLKALIDQLPETRLEAVRRMLEHHINPLAQHPQVERMQRQSQEYRRQVLQQFRDTGKPGTISTGGGTAGFGTHKGTPFGRHPSTIGMTKHLYFSHVSSSTDNL
jgi:muconolactone delta-isomerase